jgi:hypothetical protein
MKLRDQQYAKSIIAFDPYGSFDAMQLMLVLRQFGYDLGHAVVRKSSGTGRIRSDDYVSGPKDYHTLANITPIKGCKDNEACGSIALDKLLCLLESIGTKEMIVPLQVNRTRCPYNSIKARTLLTVIQYLHRYLKALGYHQSQELTIRDISVDFLTMLIKRFEEIDHIAAYKCICQRRVLIGESRIFCQNCFGEYHPQCFERYANALPESDRLICHQCHNPLTTRIPPVFLPPTSEYKVQGMLMMRNVSKDLLLLNSIADCDGKRKSHFKSLKEHTDDYSCSVEVVKCTVYEDFCQLITVHLSQNGVDPLSELQRIVAMNPSEIGVKMGHTLSEYAFAFPNIIQHMHDSNPELDYSKQLELLAKKLQRFPHRVVSFSFPLVNQFHFVPNSGRKSSCILILIPLWR